MRDPAALAREWGPYLALPDGQNPRFGGWRLKPRVQARDRTTQYRPRGGVGPGQTTLHNSQCAVLLKCLPPWGGRTSAETELGLGNTLAIGDSNLLGWDPRHP